MSNEIYQKVARVIIAHYKSFFKLYMVQIITLFISLYSLFLAIERVGEANQPANIEIYCPDDFNQTVEDLRSRVENLKL